MYPERIHVVQRELVEQPHQARRRVLALVALRLSLWPTRHGNDALLGGLAGGVYVVLASSLEVLERLPIQFLVRLVQRLLHVLSFFR